MFRMFNKTNVFGFLLFVFSVSVRNCDVSKLDGSLTRTPDLVENGMEVQMKCMIYLEDESQQIIVDLSIVPGESSPNAGKSIETYKNKTSKHQEEDGRWVVTQHISFTARTEDDPVKAECFYYMHRDVTTFRNAGDSQTGWQLVKMALDMFIDIFDDPEIMEKHSCDPGQPIESCQLGCKFVHNKRIKLSPGSCQWLYRPSADSPTIVISSTCTVEDGTTETLSLGLKSRGAFAGQYLCHADYNYAGIKYIKSYTLNGVIVIDKSIKDGAEEGTCQCEGTYPNIHSRTVDDVNYVISCYDKENQPTDACIEPKCGLMDSPLTLLILVGIIVVLATAIITRR